MQHITIEDHEKMHGSLIGGADAASYVAYAWSSHVFLQPYFDGHRSAFVGESLLELAQNDKKNIRGQVPAVVKLGGGASNGHDLLKTSGDDVSQTVLTGSIFLRKMLPNVYHLVANRVPCVIHVASLQVKNGEVANHMADIACVRETGSVVIFASGVQDTHDMAIASHLIAERALCPVFNCFDGSRIASEIAKIRLESVDSLSHLLAEGGLDEASPSQIQVVESALHSVGSHVNRTFKFFEYYGPKQATVVLVACGVIGQSLIEAIRARVADKTNTSKANVGLLCVRVFRPWSAARFVEALPDTTEKVLVIDQTHNDDTPLFKDIATSFHGDVQLVTPYLMSGNIVLPSHVGITPSVADALIHYAHTNEKNFFSADHLGIKNVFDNKRQLASTLLKQVAIWSVGTPALAVHALSTVLGPQLNLNVQQSDSVSYMTGVCHSDIRYGPMEITSEYPILGADVIALLDASVLMLPQADILAQSKASGSKLLVNASWKTVTDLNQELSAAMRKEIAQAKTTIYVVDADELVGQDHAAWLMVAAILQLCGPLPADFMQSSMQLQKLVSLNASDFHLHNLIPAVESHIVQISYDQDAWLALPGEAAEETELSLAQQTFVPSDMTPFGVVNPPQQRITNPSVAAYHQLLSQLFGERLAVADTNDNDAPASMESHFGRYTVKLQGRDRLIKYVKHFLGNPSNATMVSKDLIGALSVWYTVHDNALKTSKIMPHLLELLDHERHKHEGVEFIYHNRNLLPKTSKWILGGDHWSYDFVFSGIHHLLSSKQNINILVFDSDEHLIQQIKEAHAKSQDLDVSSLSLVSSVVGDNDVLPQDSSKKDIGLYAMNYGTAYVASISASANQAQALRAFSEADDFQGPSIIIAHAPSSTAVARKSVEEGLWPLYRWNPTEENNEFKLDSTKLKKELQEFLSREQQLSMLAVAQPKLPEEATEGSLESRLIAQHKQLEAEAQQRRLEAQFDSLANGMGSKNQDLKLVVLYGSDGGNAASVAEKLAKKAEVSGCGEVRCMEANDFKIDELSEEKHLVMVLATAGQGETCANAKHFVESLTGYSSKLPGLKFAVFGLGDSHYWGEGTQDSQAYFCLSARIVDEKLHELGAERLVPVGLGDDRDDDGYDGALTEWEPELWKSLDVTIVEGANLGGAPAIIDDDIKIKSDFLRGMIDEGLADLSTGKLLPEDTKLTKFHGIYQQDLRSVREELDAKGLERAYSFMIRIGVPGGVATSEQYIAMDDLCTTYANGALKVTTRQAYQFHGVLKRNLKTTMKGINRACMDTLAACGDVNRNVIANPHVRKSPLHRQVNQLARSLDKHLKPQTSAYAEIWLDKKRVAGTVDEEPIYGTTYLPRKFKIAIAVPPLNDVDVFSHCLGFIAIADSQGKLEGYNVCVGGGMGTTHGNKATYPRLSDVMGFCTPEQAVIVAEKVVLVQRDHGERENRKHARLKYTVEDMGLDVFRGRVEALAGFKLGKQRPFKFNTNADPYGWSRGIDGLWDYTMYVENGYIKDSETYKIKTALREIAEFHKGGEISLTATQNVIIGAIPDSRKAEIQAIMDKYNIDNKRYSAMRLHSMACVALPTCALAMAAAQTYLPSLVEKLEKVLMRVGLRDDAITIRMTGCPNGCARPYMAEIAFVGKAPGQYNIYLGGGFAGNRINKMYREGVDEVQILEILTPMLENYATKRLDGERFGDFVIRTGVIEPTLHGKCFWSHGEENLLTTPSGTTQIYW